MHLFTSKFVERPRQVEELPGSVSTPSGFKAAGVAAGIKASGNRDVGLLVSEQPCSSAAVFTTNAAAAAPIIISREAAASGELRAVVVNSGNANACTREQGLTDARVMAAAASEAIGIEADRIAVASTGIIGEPLPMEKVTAGINTAAAELSRHGGGDLAEAIRTTDRLDKAGAVEVKLPEGKVRIGACAKGAGMIAPEMATMLAFITTDAAVSPGALGGMLKTASAASFNTVSVDGDMSTNDCLLLLANGSSGISIESGSVEMELFGEALAAVCKGLALKMVADGEGATRTVEFKVSGAADAGEALRVARANATSTLVRTAFYGRDANWGRIMAATGAALAGAGALAADIHYESICLARDGAACPEAAADGQRLQAVMEQQEISVSVDLKRGEASHTMYFSDLTHDYVTLNAEYTT